jgi:hypothetical protein
MARPHLMLRLPWLPPLRWTYPLHSQGIWAWDGGEVLNSSNSVVISTPITSTDQFLPAGTYQLSAYGAAVPNTGTGGPASGEVDLSITPEPASLSLLPFALLAASRRRHPKPAAISSSPPSPSSAHKDYSPP